MQHDIIIKNGGLFPVYLILIKKTQITAKNKTKCMSHALNAPYSKRLKKN